MWVNHGETCLPSKFGKCTQHWDECFLGNNYNIFNLYRAKESWSYAAKVILLMISKFSSNGFHDLTSSRHTISKIFIIFQQNFVHINAISCKRLRLLLWKPTALQKKIPQVLSWWYHRLGNNR